MTEKADSCKITFKNSSVRCEPELAKKKVEVDFLESSDAIQLLIILVLVALSAFFSSSETALTTVNKIRIRTLADAGDSRAAMVLKVTGNPGKMLSAILIGNNIVNMYASSLTTLYRLSCLETRW